MKTLLILTTILALFLCSGCASAGDHAQSAKERSIGAAEAITTILVRLPGRIYDLLKPVLDPLASIGSDAGKVPQDVCQKIQQPEVKAVVSAISPLPIDLIVGQLKLEPATVAKVGLIGAAGPVLIVRWAATGLILVCEAIFPAEQKRTPGTAIVIVCDQTGCQSLEQKRSSLHLAPI